MKVIVQDICSKEYLSEDGQWVTSTAQAMDFSTLLRAYHFARENTSGRFQVLLYCEEDQYSACIIEGEGTAELEAAVPGAPVPAAADNFVRLAEKPGCSIWSRSNRFDWVGNPLN